MTARRLPRADVYMQMATRTPPRLSSFYTICEMFVILL